MSNLIRNVTQAFSSQFGGQPDLLVRAPGRVNLIGEHTDYNDGFVLPCAIDYETVVGIRRRNDRQIHVVAVDYDSASDEFELDNPITFIKNKMWANYVRGVIKFLMVRGYQLCGAEIAISGNVPQGAGLSSSAALEVGIGQAFKSLLDLPVSQAEVALNGQQAENEFVGCNCGIMDQLISAQGERGHALLIDCRSLETTPVPMPENLVVMIINSNKKRGLVESEYNTRRKQCEEAARLLGVKALRDLSYASFVKMESRLDPVVAMRARHVISENERTTAAAEALRNGDIKQLAALMAGSHQSMRDWFEITVKEIDTLVDIVNEVVGDEGGVRMTGGGFGGCVVAVVPPDYVTPVMEAIDAQYQPRTGLKADIYVCTAKDGAGVIRH